MRNLFVKSFITLSLLSFSMLRLPAVLPVPSPIITPSLVRQELIITREISGQFYSIQVATNLSGPWTNFQTNQAINTSSILAFPAFTNAPFELIRVWDLTYSSYFFAFHLALIPSGSFTMGDTLDEENDAMPTNINMPGFYMQTNLVTYGQWQSVYSWAITNGYSFDNPGSGKGTNYPVTGINWFDAVKWCNAYSKQASLSPVYFTDIGLTNVYTNGDMVIIRRPHIPILRTWNPTLLIILCCRSRSRRIAGSLVVGMI